jgi:hypothetical protein
MYKTLTMPTTDLSINPGIAYLSINPGIASLYTSACPIIHRPSNNILCINYTSLLVQLYIFYAFMYQLYIGTPPASYTFFYTLPLQILIYASIKLVFFY